METMSMLEQHFPHIVQGLQTSWIDPVATDHFLQSILVDDRDGRAGFPAAVFDELMFISDLNWKRRHFNEQGVEFPPDDFSFGGL
ncbi:MAG: hypothetical protein PHR30_11450 [Gallionellaceae bacterium]|nr:hypothetical protein [Gallionellaceae bacterium]